MNSVQLGEASYIHHLKTCHLQYLTILVVAQLHSCCCYKGLLSLVIKLGSAQEVTDNFTLMVFVYVEQDWEQEIQRFSEYDGQSLESAPSDQGHRVMTMLYSFL